jgi:uroporphyrinogen decarboxylase
MEGYCRRIDYLAPYLKGSIDMVMFTDDLGNQDQPMLSPKLYRKMIKPRQQILFEYAKRKLDASILYHSCGAIRQFIPDLIEIGVDALNPVQISAKGMEPQGLKNDFGKDITFWGGGVDTQNVLCHKSPAEVKAAVKNSVDILAPGDGFVFCQVHNIQPDVPPANIVAMFEALDEYL